MHPELFRIPFIDYTVHSFGPMTVLGFVAAYFLIMRISRKIAASPEVITNIVLCCLIAGIVGARAFYVIHHYSQFRGEFFSVFATWNGGLEFYGGVIFAAPVVFIYLRRKKLPIRPYLDILAIGLMIGLAFGRVGCFLNGCCFGKPTEFVCKVRFPYRSFAYFSQVNPNFKRNRSEPQLVLPADYCLYIDENGERYPLPLEELDSQQRFDVTKGEYRCLSIHPTQLYSSANAAFLCFILYLFWRRANRKTGGKNRLFAEPGHTFALAFILYGITRFILESLRDDNPFEYAWWALYKGGTVSQNLGIYMIVFGAILMIAFQIYKSKEQNS
ncbi:MAG: prolipoprotein diacylglyceryl transferase [Sedimentisphaerales bacterium]|nr:prolipoprotein diacylglyceryl transferase [Sedimentisphaerales bacterium]